VELLVTSSDLNAREKQIDALFARESDPYWAGVAALFGKPVDAVTLDERDLVKRVFLRILKRRSDYVSEVEVLQRVSGMFHEIMSAISSKDLLARCQNAVVTEKLKENLRTEDQIRKIAANGFEACVMALSVAGAPDVMIHECGSTALGEEPWDGNDR
jgi:hypothetical protein